jgi:hypothetical protein
MSDDQKPKPIEDLKEGLGLLFRAAKGAVEKIPTDKIEDTAKGAVKEVSNAFDKIGGEFDKAWNKAAGHGTDADAKKKDSEKPAATAEEKKEEKKEEHYDDAYAPEPPKGPRVG